VSCCCYSLIERGSKEDWVETDETNDRMQILRVPIDDEVNRNKTDPKSLPSKSPCGCNASIFLVFVITINTFDIERVCGGEWGPWLQLLAARRYPITRQPRFISNRFPWLVSSNPSRSCLSLKLARFAVFFCYFVVSFCFVSFCFSSVFIIIDR